MTVRIRNYVRMYGKRWGKGGRREGEEREGEYSRSGEAEAFKI
jgi:hypothetical protein